MIYATAILITVLIVAAATFLTGRGVPRGISHLQEIVGKTTPINVEAFSQLRDPRNIQFLRAKLSRTDFRATQRLRARAEFDYLLGIFKNAAILIQVGDLARATPRADLAESGAKLVDAAIRVRLMAAVAIARVAIEWLLPTTSRSSPSLILRYESLRSELANIALIQCPADFSRVCDSV